MFLSSELQQPAKTPKIDSFLSTRRCTVDRAHKLNDLIAKMIVEDLRPINTVEGRGFRQLLEFCEPNYTIPGRTFFTTRLEQMFVDIKNSLQKELALTSFVALTSDIWTSSRNESYLSVTSHFIDNEWTLNHRVLTSLPVDDRHTGENIAAWLLETIEKYNVHPSKVIAMVHDNGSNIVAAAAKNEAQHNWVSVRCAAHSLQLIVNAALKSDSAITDTLAAARHVVEHFKRSALATSLLHEKQRQMSVSEHQLIMEVSTRWNSTLHMIERLIEQRWPVSSVLVDRSSSKKSGVLALTECQWEILSNLKELLQPFDAATTYVSGETYITASSLPSLIHGICVKMTAEEDDPAYVKRFKETALTQLHDRWPLELSQMTAINRNMMLALSKAAILDPRFKLKSAKRELQQYVSASLQGEAVQQLATVCAAGSMAVAEEVTVADTDPVPSTSSAADHDYFCQPTAHSASSGIDELFRDSGEDEEQSDTENNDTVEADLRQFLQEKRLARNQCPLEWWKQNSSRFKTLNRLAKLYLAIPAASAASERVFSVAGLTVNRLRSSLLPEHVDMMVTMHCNADLM